MYAKFIDEYESSAEFTTTRNKLENTHTSARNSFKKNAQDIISI